MLLATFPENAEKSNTSILALTFFLSAGERPFIVFAKRYFSAPSNIVCSISTGVCLKGEKN
jgi:hypothetical protein